MPLYIGLESIIFKIYINSKPWRFAAKAQVLVMPSDIPYLAHDSYIDTRQIILLVPPSISDIVPKGTLTPAIRHELMNTVTQHRRLSKAQTDILIQDFG